MSANLATLLKDARAESGLTQEQLARKAGNQLTASDISSGERGKSVPTDAQLKAIAKVTGVTQKSLLDAAKTARSRTNSAAKKATSSTAKKKTASKTTSSSRKTSSASSKKTSTAVKKDEYALTAAEKKLVDAYRSASSENKKLALDLLQGKAVEDSDASGIGDILQNGLSSGLGGILETLISGLGK